MTSTLIRRCVKQRSLIGIVLVGALLLTQSIAAQGPPLPNIHAAAVPIAAVAEASPAALPAAPHPASDLRVDAAAPGDTPQTLHIVILEGDEALNNIRDRTAREPIVQVEDENHKPVAGALVLFSLHGGSGGAGANFAGSLSSLSVTTGADGRARATGLQSNQVAGSFTITVQATLGALTAKATLSQTNVTPGSTTNQQNSSTNEPTSNASATAAGVRRIGSKRMWLTAAGAGAALAAVIFFGTHTSTTSISAGQGSVGH